MKVYFKSKLGVRRTNEDRHTIILNSNGQDQTKQTIDMYGIYDGHGGSHVSTILSDIAPKLFLDKRITYPLHKNHVNKICSNVQKILSDNFTAKTKECGSTCLMVFKFKYNDADVLNIVNIGDSRAIICAGTAGVALTMDHKPLNPVEKQRITRQGGSVYFDGLEWRVDNLSLSRAFGDTSSKYTPPIPDLFMHKISKNDKFMIMACDGLWDVVDNQTAVNFVLHFCFDGNGKRINEKLNIAAKLADFALSQGSTDNVSVIIVFFV